MTVTSIVGPEQPMGAGCLQLVLAAGAQPPGFEPPADAQQVEGGGWLVVEAYALVWLFVFALLVLSMLRLRRMERRIDQLEAELKGAGEPEPPKEAG